MDYVAVSCRDCYRFGEERHQGRRRILGVVGLLLALVLLACSGEPRQASTEGRYTILSVHAAEPISAAQLELSLGDDQLEFVGVAPLQDNILAHAHDDERGGLRVALVSATTVSGDLLEIAFRSDGHAGAIETTSTRAYADTTTPASNAIRIATDHRSTPGQAKAYDPTAKVQTMSTAPGMQQAFAPPNLSGEFANYRLGDVNRDGEIDVLDVLGVLEIATGRNPEPSDFELYHSDLTLSGTIDVQDVLKLLIKAVDPTLKARIHVAPGDMERDEAMDGGRVLLGNLGNQSWSSVAHQVTPGISVEASHGIEGHSAAYTVEVVPTWHRGTIRIDADEAGSYIVVLGQPAITLLVAGQSNAVGIGLPMDDAESGVPEVRMLANDYHWKEAYEPLDDPTGQVDLVSRHPDPKHSFGVRLGKELLHAAGNPVYLIPSSLGATQAYEWLPGSDLHDRTTLFGSTNFRAYTSAKQEGGPVTALIWWQGESNSRYAERRAAFIPDTNTIMDTFWDELRAPTIYVQLAAHRDYTRNLTQQFIRDKQRRMEVGTGDPVERDHFFMVVAHDLPLSDDIHLSAEGQRIMGERISLAYRQHVLGEDVNGTGPRLVSITRPTENTIKVKTTSTINDHHSYDNYFSVREVGAAIPITDVRRDPNDDTAVLITLERAPQSDWTLRYMPPHDRPLYTRLENVIQDSDGLPLPAFGHH